MSVYVDRLFIRQSKDPQAFRVGQKTGHQWCHMTADTEEELHAMARKIGMKRVWFQASPPYRKPHYDLVPRRRVLAVKYGAIELGKG